MTGFSFFGVNTEYVEGTSMWTENPYAGPIAGVCLVCPIVPGHQARIRIKMA